VDALALDDVFDLGLSAVLDAFQTANELIEMAGLAVPRFEVKIVGMRKAIKISQGLSVPVRAVGTRTPECVMVPAIGWVRNGGKNNALTFSQHPGIPAVRIEKPPLFRPGRFFRWSAAFPSSTDRN